MGIEIKYPLGYACSRDTLFRDTGAQLKSRTRAIAYTILNK